MLVRRLARPMLSSIFIYGGVNALKAPKAHAEVVDDMVNRVADAAQPAAQKLATKVEGSTDQAASAVGDAADTAADKVDAATDVAKDKATGESATAKAGDAGDQATAKAQEAAGKVGALATDVRSGVHDVAAGKPLPFETETYVKANAAVQVGAGVLLVLGKAPRLASTALAATIIPTTIAAHRFWEMEGEERANNEVHFFKNVSLLGGLIIAAIDTEGQPGLAYRASHLGHEVAAGKAAKANAKAAKKLSAANAQAAAKAGTRKGKKASKAAKKQTTVLSALAAKQGGAASKVARKQAKVAAKMAKKHGSAAAEMARAKSHDLAEAARKSDLPDQAAAKAAEFSAVAQAKGHDLADTIRSSEFQDRAADAVKAASDRGRLLAEQARAAVA